MQENINLVKIVLTDEVEKRIEYQLEFEEPRLIINDELIKSILIKDGWVKASTCSMNLGVNNIIVQIMNYTITECIYFEDFTNIPSSISIFKAEGTNVHIINQKVDLMQLDCSNALIANCQIRQLDVGLSEHHKLLSKISKDESNDFFSELKMKSLDLREVNIQSLKMYMGCDNINLQESDITNFNIYNYFPSKFAIEIKHIYIWNYTTIKTAEIHCNISELKISESSISNLVAKAQCYIAKFDSTNSDIYDAHNFARKHFDNMGIESWKLLGQSAFHDNNGNLRAEANFQIDKSNYRNEKGINRILGNLFGFCTGYGYKPMRALSACGVIVLCATIIYTIHDIIYSLCNGIKLFNIRCITITNLKLALAAIVGQSGMSIESGFTFWIASIEYVLGIIIFAMFVNALYVRYKD